MAVDGTGAVGEREDGASEALNGAARDRVAGTNWGAADRRRGGADGDTEGNAAADGEAWKARQSGVEAATAAVRRWEGIGVAPDADVADEEADKRGAVCGTRGGADRAIEGGAVGDKEVPKAGQDGAAAVDGRVGRQGGAVNGGSGPAGCVGAGRRGGAVKAIEGGAAGDEETREARRGAAAEADGWIQSGSSSSFPPIAVVE